MSELCKKSGEIAPQVKSQLPEIRTAAIGAIGQAAADISDDHLAACYVFGMTGDILASANMSGYTPETVRALLSRTSYANLVRCFASARLQAEGFALGVNTLVQIMQDTGAPAAARVSAAKAARDWAQVDSATLAPEGKPLQDMTVAELAALVDKLHAVAQIEAKTIDITPSKQ